jgi:hypothetical protein
VVADAAGVEVHERRNAWTKHEAAHVLRGELPALLFGEERLQGALGEVFQQKSNDAILHMHAEAVMA